MEGLETPVADATPPATVDDSTREPEATVASHAAQFDPSRRESPAETPTESTATPARPERHRAQSQKARAEDVPRISELTRKLREAERELERLRQPAQVTAPDLKGPQQAAPAAQPQTATAPAGGFPELEPQLDDFMDAADPYSAWQRALGKYDRKRERWDEQQQATASRAASVSKEVAQLRESQFNQHAARVAVFAQTVPDFGAKLHAADREIPPLLEQAIIEDDNGPQILYTLATDPVFLDEMHLLTDGKPVTESSVAILRRRLTAQLTRTQAANTGSAAAMPRTSWTARPPNPVRTSPLKTGDDPPGDGHSLAEHAKHYSPKRR